MGVYIKVNGAAADPHLISMSVDNSVAERLPLASIVVDNTNNLGIGLYHSFDTVEVFFGPPPFGSEPRIFKGYIEDIDQDHEQRTIVLTCRGFAVLLEDAMIDSISYSGVSSSYIVDNLRQLYGRDGNGNLVITGNNIATTTDSISRVIKGTAAWDAIMNLAVDLGYDAWIDDDADLHFQTRAFEDSGLVIDTNSMVFSAGVSANASQAINRVVVYGGGTPQVVGACDDYGGQRRLGAVKTEFIYDDALTTQADVNNRATGEISRILGTPTKYSIKGIGFESAIAGKLVSVNLPNFGMPSGKYYCMEVIHSTPPSQTELTLYTYAGTLEDVILKIVKDLRQQQQQNIESQISSRVLRYHELTLIQPRIIIHQRQAGTAFAADLASGGQLGYAYTVLGRSGMGAETTVYDSG